MDRDRHAAAANDEGLIMKKLFVLLAFALPLFASDPAKTIERDVTVHEPERLIVFTWNAPTKFGPLRNERTYVMVRLDDASNGMTHVHLTHFGWRAGAEWDEVYGYFDKAWDVVLGRLAKRFA
jgi:uncharacterized protein YndB with AHSA1/START domain